LAENALVLGSPKYMWHL